MEYSLFTRKEDDKGINIICKNVNKKVERNKGEWRDNDKKAIRSESWRNGIWINRRSEGCIINSQTKWEIMKEKGNN